MIWEPTGSKKLIVSSDVGLELFIRFMELLYPLRSPVQAFQRMEDLSFAVVLKKHPKVVKNFTYVHGTVKVVTCKNQI
jgi:hypothetical protein